MDNYGHGQFLEHKVYKDFLAQSDTTKKFHFFGRFINYNFKKRNNMCSIYFIHII